MKLAVQWTGLALTVIAFSFQLLTDAASIKPLYTTADTGLVILDNSNFSSHLSHRNTGFFVEFYNTWCGHCIKFAPIFKEFARDVQNWSSVVQLAVLDCAEDRNHDICRDYEIYMFPSLRFYASNYTPMRDYSLPKPDAFTSNSNMSGVPYEGEFDSAQKLRQHLIDTVRQWENSTDLRHAFDRIISQDEHVSQAGHSSHNGQVKRPDNSHSSDNRSNQVAGSRNGGPPLSSSSRSANSPGSSHETVIAPVHMDDLFNALRYSIYNQVTMHQKLNSSQLEALKSFLRVVDEYFPFDDLDARPASFIKLLSKWSATKSQMISTDEMMTEMGQFEDDFWLPDMKPYKSCQGSSSRFRGYPCSLWLLFHSMTVNEYLKQQQSADAAADPPQHSVLPMMRQFILHFFGCTECAQNFDKESSGLEDSLTSPNSSVLWLWKTHNSVNKRLAGDGSEDPEHPKVQFPPFGLCPDCYFPNGSFNENKVLNFLLQRYHPNNIVKEKISTGIHLEARAHKVRQVKPILYEHDHQHAGPDGEPIRFVASYYNILNRTDITIFVVLYIFSISLLIGLFVFFRMRGKRKKVSHHYQISNPNLRYMA